MEVFIIVSLILAGLLLFIVEVFLIPGISIAGIASAICLLYANRTKVCIGMMIRKSWIPLC